MIAANWPDRPALVVDDDVSWVQLMQQALTSMGWREVRTLSEPEHAVDLASEFAPAVILLDLRMKGRDGHSLLREFRERLPSTPVLMLTGVDDTDEAVSCLREGAVDYLTKPLKRERLAQALRTALGLQEDPHAEREQPYTFEDALLDMTELPHLKAVPDLLIDEAVRRANGVIKDAASMLGISSQAICNRRRRRAEAAERD